MKVYTAKDWTGYKVFAEPPVLIKCGGMPDVWSGHKLPFQLSKDVKIPRIEEIIEWNIGTDTKEHSKIIKQELDMLLKNEKVAKYSN